MKAKFASADTTKKMPVKIQFYKCESRGIRSENHLGLYFLIRISTIYYFVNLKQFS